jgi:hypothetical protein
MIFVSIRLLSGVFALASFRYQKNHKMYYVNFVSVQNSVIKLSGDKNIFVSASKRIDRSPLGTPGRCVSHLPDRPERIDSPRRQGFATPWKKLFPLTGDRKNGKNRPG